MDRRDAPRSFKRPAGAPLSAAQELARLNTPGAAFKSDLAQDVPTERIVNKRGRSRTPVGLKAVARLTRVRPVIPEIW